jgi:hypothetical protein
VVLNFALSILEDKLIRHWYDFNHPYAGLSINININNIQDQCNSQLLNNQVECHSNEYNSDIIKDNSDIIKDNSDIIKDNLDIPDKISNEKIISIPQIQPIQQTSVNSPQGIEIPKEIIKDIIPKQVLGEINNDLSKGEQKVGNDVTVISKRNDITSILKWILEITSNWVSSLFHDFFNFKLKDS